MSLLTCQNLSVGYDGKAVLENLNFSVEAGEYLAVIGENGSGKSTLMRTLLGLQPPVSGRILTGEGLHKNEIGYLPQQTIVQKDFPASVREIVLSGCQGRCGIRPFYSKEEKQLAGGAAGVRSITLKNRRLPQVLWKKCGLTIWQNAVTVSFPEDSSSAFCSPALSAPQEKCFFWTNLSPALTRRSRRNCTS